MAGVEYGGSDTSASGRLRQSLPGRIGRAPVCVRVWQEIDLWAFEAMAAYAQEHLAEVGPES